MTKRGQLKDMDAHEQSIRDNASRYTVIGFRPGSSSRAYFTFERFDWALEYSKQLLKDEVRLRSVMIYALDEHDHHALCGTIRRDDMIYKPVVPQTY